ncbi:unnamed protein product [Bursaphelenchus okinawaensis]|uniref:Uncharacterized protein n=1 Tax=Bursaphelenchus okinawaensis TaxID=465554 RepID=A0A811KM68_9BILA|nr:unnamed protein product [Bursaphelenchus okinawaensis]CAG9105854.1 unnamed protein product [Bursaphelenchus okinawaensis]
MLRITVDNHKSCLRVLLGPTGGFIKVSWQYVCPIVISLALLMDLLETPKNRSVMAGDSHLWHILSVITILPLPTMVIYYLFKKDKNAFKSEGWRKIPIPVDNNNINNIDNVEEGQDEWLENYKSNRTRKDTTVNQNIVALPCSSFVQTEFSCSGAGYFELLQPTSRQNDDFEEATTATVHDEGNERRSLLSVHYSGKSGSNSSINSVSLCNLTGQPTFL